METDETIDKYSIRPVDYDQMRREEQILPPIDRYGVALQAPQCERYAFVVGMMHDP